MYSNNKLLEESVGGNKPLLDGAVLNKKCLT